MWLDEHQLNYPKWMYGVYPSERSVREMVKTEDQYICLEGSAIVGAFVLNADPQGNYQKGRWKRDLPDGSYMVLHALAIEPGLRRQGAGSEILRFCAAKAKAEGYLALRVDTVPGNYPARNFYEKNGFTYAGDEELERGIEGLPVFSLFEMNW